MGTEDPGSTGGDLVLLIEHDAEVRRRVRRMLEARHLEVVEASNAIAGLELIQRLPGASRLIISDLELPGLSGTAVLEALRHLRPDLAVVCIAGSVTAAVTSGLPCLHKPVAEEELAAQVAAALSGRSLWQDVRGSITPPETLARARARYTASRDLVAAGLELDRGLAPDDWPGPPSAPVETSPARARRPGWRAPRAAARGSDPGARRPRSAACTLARSSSRVKGLARKITWGSRSPR